MNAQQLKVYVVTRPYCDPRGMTVTAYTAKQAIAAVNFACGFVSGKIYEVKTDGEVEYVDMQ